jgi:capsular polysaccharide biosynthesis protein
MLNERELARVLAQQGFMLIEPSRYPLMEEIALFRNAEEIVFTFGSAAANAVFCNQDVKILLLQPDSTSSKHFGMMLGCLGATFGYVYGVSFHRRERHHNTEWVIDPKLVLEGLERLR